MGLKETLGKSSKNKKGPPKPPEPPKPPFPPQPPFNEKSISYDEALKKWREQVEVERREEKRAQTKEKALVEARKRYKEAVAARRKRKQQPKTEKFDPTKNIMRRLNGSKGISN